MTVPAFNGPLAVVVGFIPVVIGYGNGAVQLAGADPTGSFYATLTTFVGKTMVDIVQVVLCACIFADSLSTHNMTAGYVFNMGADGIFSRKLASIHHGALTGHRS